MSDLIRIQTVQHSDGIPERFEKSYFEKFQHTTKKHSKTCVKWPHSKRPKIGLQEQLSLTEG